MIQIIDGNCKEPNIFAEDIGAYNIALFGPDDYVFAVGNELGYQEISNNEIRIKDGMFMTQGRRGVIKKGTTISCVIENGRQGVVRTDMIVIEYRKEVGTLLESHTIKVVKGPENAGGAFGEDPVLVKGNIPNGDYVHQMPLYRVRISGINILSVTKLFNMAKSFPGMEKTEVMEVQNDSGGKITAVKNKMHCDLSIYLSYKASSVGWKTVSVLPKDMRPKTNYNFLCAEGLAANFADSKAIRVRIQTSGNIDVYCYPDKLSGTVAGAFSYLIQEEI